MAELLSEKLSHAGFVVVSAPTGKEGLAKIAKDKPSLVLLDLPLTGEVDGFEVLKKIRAQYDLAALPVVTLFNLDDSAGVEKCISLGANACLVKAFTETDEIISRFKDVLQNKSKQFIPKEFLSQKADHKDK